MLTKIILTFTFLFNKINSISSEYTYYGPSSQYVIEDPLCKHRSVDNSKTTQPLRIQTRVMDLMNGEHFDDVLRDTPDIMRPPSIILFYNTSSAACKHEYSEINYDYNVMHHLPSRGFLYAAQYDIDAAPQRLWYKFTPERDLVKRFGVDPQKCLSLVWVPRECNGFTEWCVNKVDNGIEYLGCDNYGEQCQNVEIYSGKHPNILDNNWLNWVNNKIETQSNKITLGGPNPNKHFRTYHEQESWIAGRDSVTTQTQLRNAYGSSALPAFTKLGYKSVQIPDDIMNEFIAFYNKNKHQKRDENWQSYGQTQVNGHEVSPYLIYMDLDMTFRDSIAEDFIKPILEEWVGFELELTSHYGLREYHSGAWLRNHIDRIDVLVISVTLSLFHLKKSDLDRYLTLDSIDTWSNDTHWPIEAVDFEGNNVRYPHKPGTMMLYESAKLIHGRPYPLPFDENGEELVHIGSFCHFRPKDGSWGRNNHARNAQKNIQRFKKHETLSGRPSYRPPSNYKNDL